MYLLQDKQLYYYLWDSWTGGLRRIRNNPNLETVVAEILTDVQVILTDRVFRIRGSSA